MRETRKSYIKVSVYEEEKEAYAAGAAQKAQTLSEWVRLSLRETLGEMGYNWEKAAAARLERGRGR